MRTYTITGQVFFASADRFINAFDYREVIEKVRIDVSRAAGHHRCQRLGQSGYQVPPRGHRGGSYRLNEASSTMVDKFAVHDKDGAEDMLMGH
jgi:SulP family sulfate permease